MKLRTCLKMSLFQFSSIHIFITFFSLPLLSQSIMTFPENGVYSLFPNEDLRTGRKLRFEDDRRERQTESYRDYFNRGRGDYPLVHPRDPPLHDDDDDRDLDRNRDRDFIVPILRPGTRRLENTFERQFRDRAAVGYHSYNRELPNFFRDRDQRRPRVFFEDEERRVFGFGNKYYHNELPPLSSREENLIRPSAIDYAADGINNRDGHRINNPNFRYLPEAKLPPRARDRDEDDENPPPRIHLFDPNSKFGRNNHKEVNVGIPDGPVIVDGPDRGAFLNHDEFLTFHTKIALETLEKEKKKLEEAARRRLYGPSLGAGAVEDGGVNVVGLSPPKPDSSKEVNDEEGDGENEEDNNEDDEDENNISTTTNDPNDRFGTGTGIGISGNNNNNNNNNSTTSNSIATTTPSSTTVGFVPVVPFQLQGITHSDPNVVKLNTPNSSSKDNRQNLSSSSSSSSTPSSSSSSSSTSKINYNFGNYPQKNGNDNGFGNTNKNAAADVDDDDKTTPGTSSESKDTTFNLPSYSVFGKKTTTPINFTPGRIPITTSKGTTFLADIKTTSPSLNINTNTNTNINTNANANANDNNNYTKRPFTIISVTPAPYPTSSASFSSSSLSATFDSKKVVSISSIPFRTTVTGTTTTIPILSTTRTTPTTNTGNDGRKGISVENSGNLFTPTTFNLPATSAPVPFSGSGSVPVPSAAPFFQHASNSQTQSNKPHNQMMIYVQRVKSPNAWRRQTQQSHYFNKTTTTTTTTNGHKLHLHTHSLNKSSATATNNSTNLKIQIHESQSQSQPPSQPNPGFSFDRAKKRKTPNAFEKDRLSHSNSINTINRTLNQNENGAISITRNGINSGVVSKIHAHISQCPRLYGDVEIICDVHIREKHQNPNPQLLIGWVRKFHNESEDQLLAINKTLAYDEQDFHDKFNVTLAASISPMLRSVLQIRDVDSEMTGIYQCEVFDGVSKLKSETLLFLCH